MPPGPRSTPAAALALLAALALGPPAAQAQAGAPAAAASAPQRVEITATRESDTEARRQSTASKIVIGREEIDRFGDSTVGEVLKRLPGVTMPGAPGRGRGGPRMRGLGAGYTQILIDGQRVPPGFSIESLTPEQIERIEILRAPTAETGARAIGGTINIVTREGFRRRLNNLRLGFAVEDGQVTPGLFWTRNDSAGNLIYTVSGSAFRNRRSSHSTTATTETVLDDGSTLRDQVETSDGLDTRKGLNLTSRLQWRLGGADSLTLMPVVFHARTDGRRQYGLDDAGGLLSPPYDQADSASDSRFTVGRLNLQLRATLGDGLRLELNGGASQARSRSESTRHEFDGAGTALRTTHDQAATRDRTGTLTTKLSRLLDGDHSLVAGAELERLARSETRVAEQDDRDLLAEFEPELRASSTRVAAYLQDEWTVNANWSAHAGLRWEGIVTRGDSGLAGDTQTRDNRSRVLTPLLHAVWKPDAQSRDQLRISLTRSYKSPTLQNLVARPLLSSRYPAGTENVATSPDRVGNPALRPELATGIDVAVERYLPQGGVLSANLFHRRITDYIRTVTVFDEQAAGGRVDGVQLAGRYVAVPRNLGRAVTQGVELEAKFRLDQLQTGAPPTELRANLSLFRSRVAEVPGPDNRLDEQPTATLNLGADHRFRGTPLTLGGSLNLTPGYRTQLSELQTREAGAKRQFDAYALWVFDPAAQLRLLASNLTAADYRTVATVDSGRLRTQAVTAQATAVNWQLRLELKL